jgi:predicted RNA-binding protein YlxR (DUF448 family)
VEARHPPERTCVGCRAKDFKAALMRLVRAPDGMVVFDDTGTAPGRGAYLHHRERCLAAAQKSGAIGRALRTPLDAALVATLMTELRTSAGEGT